MELKDLLFYTLCVFMTPYAAYEAYNLVQASQILKNEHPECYQTNPNQVSLFIGTQIVLMCLMLPVQSVSKSLFMKALPIDKFPLDTKIRSTKAEIMSERMFRFFVYLTTSGLIFWILKQGNFLGPQLLGSIAEPQYFINYPCQPLPKYLDDFYIIKFAYHFFEMAHAFLFHRNRRDFSEFLLHHIMTMVLIGYSYYSNFIPIGSVIMLVMDFSDIFVALFKISIDVNESVQALFFYAMLGSWVYYRIWYYPMHQIMAIYYQAYDHPHVV